ncbi:MAG: xanthine dehydrogenase family protein molybdopterin-binding subunit [Pyrinomonadaceae bacterium]|nr:xanthine dehydrogenase family protein molybdopterin-binding subunit [Pyrinomonadaceae bacterium]
MSATEMKRRDFFKTGAALGGGLLLSLYVPEWVLADSVHEATPLTPSIPPFAPNAFVRIGTDNIVTVIVNKSEMGQGVYTSLPMLVAEELEADWSKVRYEPAPVDAAYNHPVFGIQMTGGSTSTASEWERFRQAGATARVMLIGAAAKNWKVDSASLRAENGYVINPASGARASFGSLAEVAATMTPPKDVPLKDPKDFKLIGKPTRRLDTPDKVNGAAQFGLDIAIPGMMTVLVARAPVFGGKVLNFNADKAKAVPGVKNVVQIPSGVAVIAKGFWPAKQGRDKLEISWDDGPNAALSTTGMREQYATLAKTPGLVARKVGDPTKALAGATKTITAEYEMPYLAHAAMEPLNCVVDLRSDRCEIWTGTQFQTGDRAAAAAAAGLKPEQVTIHTPLLGGGFGRRANPASDFVIEAVQVAKAAKAPVKVVWTREDDTRGGWYRPMWSDRFTGGIDEKGNPVVWAHTIVGQSIIAGTPFEGFLIKDGIDGTSVEGAADLLYGIPNLQVDLHTPKIGVPVLWWRSVGHSHNGFAVEAFFDELAHAGGKDPYELRRTLLADQPRMRAVLELAAQKGDWGKRLPAGRGRGIATHFSFSSYVAQVAEVSVDKQGAVRVHRMVCAVDCGRVVNPDTVKAQMEGGINFGLTAALKSEITLDRGRVQQRNFHDYQMLRINEAPEIEVYIVPSTEKPTGVGEPSVPPVAPAVANAIFAASGKRIRKLPILKVDLRG